MKLKFAILFFLVALPFLFKSQTENVSGNSAAVMFTDSLITDEYEDSTVTSGYKDGSVIMTTTSYEIREKGVTRDKKVYFSKGVPTEIIIKTVFRKGKTKDDQPKEIKEDVETWRDGKWMKVKGEWRVFSSQ